MTQNCYSMRPGTILGFKGRSWRVISNDTLLERFTCCSLDPPHDTKSFRYPAGKEIDVRWIPFSNR